MTERLSRPTKGATLEERGRFGRELLAALTKLGVEPGMDFIVTAAGPTGSPNGNDIGGFRGSDPDTSRKAAIDAYPRTGAQRHHALLAIASAGERGMTYAEVEKATGINGVWKRLSELKDGGWIRTDGERQIEATGSDGDVYVLTEKAAREIRTREELPAEGGVQPGLFATTTKDPNRRTYGNEEG